MREVRTGVCERGEDWSVRVREVRTGVCERGGYVCGEYLH